MTIFDMAAILIMLAALFSYLNYTVVKLPPAIGLMALSLAGSMVLVLIGSVVPVVEGEAKNLVHRIDLQQTFLHGMLGFMLFAGSLHIDSTNWRPEVAGRRPVDRRRPDLDRRRRCSRGAC